MAQDLDPDLTELSRDVVQAVAPAELPLFNAISREYAKNPDKAVKAAADGDEVLGFGVAAGLLLTPIIMSVAQTVLKFVRDEILKLARQEATNAVDKTARTLVARVLAPKAQDKALPHHAPALNPDQLLEVRKVAISRALSLDLPRDQAERLADAMVARLAIAAA